MSLSKAYKLDDKKITAGIEVELPANEDGSIPTFVIARAGRGNKRYSAALERSMRPLQAELRTKNLKNDKAEKALIEAFVEGCLVSWKNVLKSDVTGVESDTGYADFSASNALALMNNLPELYVDLQERANDFSLFREGEQDESAKN